MEQEEKTSKHVKGFIKTGEKEEINTSYIMKEDGVHLSVQPPGKNFEFVTVKEEILDECNMYDNSGTNVDENKEMGVQRDEKHPSSKNRTVWSCENENTFKTIDKSPINVVMKKQSDFQLKCSNIQDPVIKKEQDDLKSNTVAPDSSNIDFTASQAAFSLPHKKKLKSYKACLSNDSYVGHVDVNFAFKTNALKHIPFLNRSFNHTEEIKPSTNYRCSVCLKTFTLQSNMKKHKRLHLGVKPYHCSQCKQCFARKADLERHNGVHTNDRPYHCSVCRKSFKYKYGLSMHFKLHKGEGHECKICNKSFSTRHILERHKRIHSDQKVYQCSLCKAVFNERNCLNQHARLHTQERPRPFECPVCEKKFITRHDLERHCRTHTGEKPYQCATCEKSFSDRGDLTRHLVVHSGEKRYICNICNKAFTMQSSLKTHQRVHSGDKPYPCNICKKRFSQKANVVRHMKTHGIEKNKQA